MTAEVNAVSAAGGRGTADKWTLSHWPVEVLGSECLCSPPPPPDSHARTLTLNTMLLGSGAFWEVIRSCGRGRHDGRSALSRRALRAPSLPPPQEVRTRNQTQMGWDMGGGSPDHAASLISNSQPPGL